jgi:hypothetical protein
MFMWLKPGAEKRVKELMANHVLGDFKIYTQDNTGKKYITVYGNILSPTTEIPNIPDELIDTVTLKEEFENDRGFCAEGLYQLGEEAELLVTDSHQTISSGYGDEILNRQDIEARAKTVTAMKEIYSLVRQHKLSPAQNWESNHHAYLTTRLVVSKKKGLVRLHIDGESNIWAERKTFNEALAEIIQDNQSRFNIAIKWL